MPFPFDIYPWANYQELNLAYFIARFQEIFRQWADLYETMTAWQEQTDADLETWKTGVVNDIIAREAALRQELAAWKTTTEQDISSWESATLAALTAWQTAAETQFEAIRTQAAASATAAAGSAADAATAKTAAETAQAAAEAAAASVTESAAQIAANTADIASLQAGIFSTRFADCTQISGTSAQHANLDSYTTPGNYYVSNANYVDNSPATNAYRLQVIQLISTSSPAQIAFLYPSSSESSLAPRFAVRAMRSGNWSQWSIMVGQNWMDDYAKYGALALSANNAVSLASQAGTSVDLDTLITPGNYAAKSTAAAGRISNGPVSNTTYRLMIVATSGADRIFQIALINSSAAQPNIAVRCKTSSGWTTWSFIADQSAIATLQANIQQSMLDMTAAIGQRFSGYLANASEIADGSDLNNIITPGNYVVTDATHAGTMLHGPRSTAGYSLIVSQLGGTSAVSQIALMQSNASELWFRTLYNNSWSPWVRPFGIKFGTFVSTSNVQKYFPNGSFNDLTENVILNLSSLLSLTDGPQGDTRIIDPTASSGSIGGTILVYSVGMPGAPATGVVQLLVGSRSAPFFPTLSYRIAIYSGGNYTWSAWSKFEQNGYLHGSNAIVYGGSMVFDDMDDMPANTIYQLDLNLDGSDAAHTLAHHPAPGVSCVAICYAYSYSSDHGKVQVVYTIDGRMFWRYGYFQSADDYRWTAWNFLPKLPASLPTADGTYTLKCTVSSGAATLSWVADT